MKNILFDFTDAQLEQFMVELGEQKFRAKQIREWLWRGAPDFSVMKNLPENLRDKLSETAATLPVQIVQKLESEDGQTIKFLLRLGEGELLVETVLMRTTYGNSVCVSSQAGCAMGCKFCASTLLGLKRNLTINEMLAQVLVAKWVLQSDVTHVVIMGTGEPLQNTENTIGFIESLHDKLNIGWRHITLSTCGIVPGIERITEWGRPINLAISLHAATDRLRAELMPINNKYKITEVMKAAFANTEKTKRQLMIEYILLAGFNDSAQHAQELSELLRGKNVMVNLIPFNAVTEHEFVAPSGNAVHRFQDALIKDGVHTRIRKERGADIGSACGQLRLNNN
jgi:23S rRNA (adenine2503-C2)-methyltransferase